MTKLNKNQKASRKELREMMPNVQLFSFPEMGVTVGIERTGNTMARFAVAIASDDEPRFRRKVGEFTVLSRFMRGETLPTRFDPAYRYAESAAHLIADAVA